MTMAMVLEYTAEWFRDKYGYTHAQCNVYPEARPPMEAMGPFFIAIDDAGIETGREDTDSLREICTIQIGIWRRSEHLIKNLAGLIKFPTDKYIAGAFTLAQMERKVLVTRTYPEPLYGLHQNWAFINGLNTRYNLPSPELGDSFKFPFVYRGRGQMEDVGYADDRGTVRVWHGYRLRFRGVAREQKRQHTATTPLG